MPATSRGFRCWRLCRPAGTDCFFCAAEAAAPCMRHSFCLLTSKIFFLSYLFYAPKNRPRRSSARCLWPAFSCDCLSWWCAPYVCGPVAPVASAPSLPRLFPSLGQRFGHSQWYFCAGALDFWCALVFFPGGSRASPLSREKKRISLGGGGLVVDRARLWSCTTGHARSRLPK